MARGTVRVFFLFIQFIFFRSLVRAPYASMFPYGGILISPSSISTHAVPGFLLARAADSSEKTEDSGGNGEWLGGFGNKNELFLPGERAVQSNKPKGMAKQKRQVGQSNALSEKPVDETPPIWKAFFKATKEKLFTGTLKNISVWTGLAIIVSVIATYAAYRSLNQFRDTSFRQMEEQLNATRARHDELAQQNPQERLIEATENAKQQTITLQRIRASQQQGVSDLLAEGIARDSNTALANLGNIQISRGRIERLKEDVQAFESMTAEAEANLGQPGDPAPVDQVIPKWLLWNIYATQGTTAISSAALAETAENFLKRVPPKSPAAKYVKQFKTTLEPHLQLENELERLIRKQVDLAKEKEFDTLVQQAVRQVTDQFNYPSDSGSDDEA